MQGPPDARLLSRELVSLWADDYLPALALMKRIFPPGLVRMLTPASAKRGKGMGVAVGGGAGGAGAGAGSGGVGGVSGLARVSTSAPTQPQMSRGVGVAEGVAGSAMGGATVQAVGGPLLQPGGIAGEGAAAAGAGANGAAAGVEGGAQVAAQQQQPQPQSQLQPHTIPPPPSLSLPTAPVQAGVSRLSPLMRTVRGMQLPRSLDASPQVSGSIPAGAPLSPRAPSRGPGSFSGGAALESEDSNIVDVFGDLLTCDWRAFWHAVDGEHAGAALVWGQRCRGELGQALEAEMAGLRRARERVAQVG